MNKSKEIIDDILYIEKSRKDIFKLWILSMVGILSLAILNDNIVLHYEHGWTWKVSVFIEVLIPVLLIYLALDLHKRASSVLNGVKEWSSQELNETLKDLYLEANKKEREDLKEFLLLIRNNIFKIANS